MAKQSTVTYKFGLESIRGKLATKQKPILYEGQSDNEPVAVIGNGIKRATNFEKYMVLTVRRGKNGFYIKSRTSVNNSLVSVTSRTIFALAASYANEIYKIVKDYYNRGNSGAIDIYESYKFYRKDGETFREFITSLVVQFVAARRENICYYTVPTEESLSESVDFATNPFTSLEYDRTNAVVTLGLQTTDAFKNTTGNLVRQYIKPLAQFTGEQLKEITIITDLGRTLKLIYAGEDMNEANYSNAIENSGDIIVRSEGEENEVVVRVQSGMIAVDGKIYRDENFNTPLVSTDSWDTYKTWYFQTIHA